MVFCCPAQPKERRSLLLPSLLVINRMKQAGCVGCWAGVACCGVWWWWDELCLCSAPRCLPQFPQGGLGAASSGEVAWDSLSPQQGWAGSQAWQLHLLLQKALLFRLHSQPKVPHNPCSELAPRKAARAIKSQAPWEEPPLSIRIFLETPDDEQISSRAWSGCSWKADLGRKDL